MAKNSTLSERTIKVALVQQHNTPDQQDNIRRLEQSIYDAAQKGAQLVVLQELHNTLYFCQEEDVNNFDLATLIPGIETQRYSRIAKDAGVVLVSSLFEKRAPGLYHNTAAVFDADGTLCGIYRKMHVPDDPAYYEKFYFTPGDQGFQPIDTSLGRLGVMVCWDQWYPEAARLMALRGARILIYPTAIGYDENDPKDEQQRQREAWITVQRGHAVANGLPLVAVNRVGYEPNPTHPERGIRFWGSSFACGPQGEILCMLPEKEEDVKVVDISLTRCEMVRRWWPFLRDRRIDAYTALTRRYDDRQ